jgi:hypothetical protein
MFCFRGIELPGWRAFGASRARIFLIVRWHAVSITLLRPERTAESRLGESILTSDMVPGGTIFIKDFWEPAII